MAANEDNPLPMFYKKPTIVSAQSHGTLALARQRSYLFASKVNSVPVVLEEIPKLLPHYPIAFTTGADPFLIALLGVRNDENLFVDGNGNWAPNVYVPAYVRRYPFILTRAPGGKVVLGAELDKDCFAQDGDPLFDQARPTKVAETAYGFCVQMQKAFEETKVFCQVIAEAEILQAKNYSISSRVMPKIELKGFAAVDEAALDALDNRTVNNWRRQHWLKHIYCHIASLEQLGSFSTRLEMRLAA